MIVGISLVPSAGPFTVLRTLRVLRVLRLISVVPAMRRIVHALFHAVPAMGAIVALLIISMWKLDRFAFAKNDSDMDKIHVKAIICILACFLWVIWTSSGYIMVRAYDEITDTGTNIPGF